MTSDISLSFVGKLMLCCVNLLVTNNTIMSIYLWNTFYLLQWCLHWTLKSDMAKNWIQSTCYNPNSKISGHNDWKQLHFYFCQISNDINLLI